MKNWIKIGRFSQETGISSRALRIYESLGLLESHTRGENNYRYYHEAQISKARNIKKLKSLGFSLREIMSLLQIDAEIDSQKLEEAMKKRLSQVLHLKADLTRQEDEINKIIHGIKTQRKGLKPNERKYIMGQFQKISVVVTGIKDLNETAEHITQYLSASNDQVPLFHWTEDLHLPKEKPYVLVLPEADLSSKEIQTINPNVVVIKNLSSFCQSQEEKYLGLYKNVGPHMATVFNADDALSVKLAANSEIRKGRTFYYSKNTGLEDQIEKIGGVISDGHEFRVYGFNLAKEVHKMTPKKPLGFETEVNILASITALLDVGLPWESFRGQV